MTVETPVLEVDANAAPAADTALVPLLYQWVLCDDRQRHVVSDEIIHSSAPADEPRERLRGQQIAMYLGRPERSASVSWRCTDAIPAHAVQAPWNGKTR